ncbi:MAG TPA: hypothetical protein VD837_18210 [Terriglobales bacterium]|nr:hypothetical protein [Terriglobales bacterium]
MSTQPTRPPKADAYDLRNAALHPAWMAFIRYCQTISFGEITTLKIQDGLPVMAEAVTKKIKFVP